MGEYSDKKGHKGRILFLEQYLMDHGDEENPVTTEELISACQENGFEVNRNTIRDDRATLEQAGMEIREVRVGNGKGYYIGNRAFENTELRTLIDAVASSQFISKSRSRALIGKLAKLAPERDRKELTGTAFEAHRVKTDSQAAFSDVGAIARAIRQGRKIYFQYVDYLPTKEMILRHGEKVYSVSPRALIWSDGRYYAASYDEEKQDDVPYRVDRMRNVKVSREKADTEHPFDLENFIQYRLNMYGGKKEEEDVTLIAENHMMIHVLDRFGEEIQTEIADEGHFRARIRVCPNHTFFSWLFQFDGAASILEPEHVKEEYREMLRKAADRQKNY